MKKILLDTDIGGDIDDALALALALNSPGEIEIAGITTVYLGAVWRAGVIRKMLNAWERPEIPVALGAEKPMIGRWDESHTPEPGKTAVVPEGVSTLHAIDFIIEQVEENEDITLVAIGPLTNVAMAICKAPHIVKKCRIILMGGQLNRAHPEWNIACDPEAARIVFESGADIAMVGLDVTNLCRFSQENIDFIASVDNPRANLLTEMIRTFINNFKFLPVLHDPLALSLLLWDDILTMEEKTVLVETRGEFTRGVTVDCSWIRKPNVKAAVGVRSSEFVTRLLDAITK